MARLCQHTLAELKNEAFSVYTRHEFDGSESDTCRGGLPAEGLAFLIRLGGDWGGVGSWSNPAVHGFCESNQGRRHDIVAHVQRSHSWVHIPTWQKVDLVNPGGVDQLQSSCKHVNREVHLSVGRWRAVCMGSDATVVEGLGHSWQLDHSIKQAVASTARFSHSLVWALLHKKWNHYASHHFILRVYS